MVPVYQHNGNIACGDATIAANTTSVAVDTGFGLRTVKWATVGLNMDALALEDYPTGIVLGTALSDSTPGRFTITATDDEGGAPADAVVVRWMALVG